MEKTCLHRGEPLEKCKNCQRDYELISLTHPVNNESCKDYYEIHIQCYTVTEKNLEEVKIK
jgi:hypothetical protein